MQRVVRNTTAFENYSAPKKGKRKMRKPKHEHSDRDRIFTPEHIAVRLVNKIPALPTDSWCDPCFGTGMFYNNFPSQNKVFYEIDMGKDFLVCQEKYDWVVTNIPFSKPKEFIDKMSECCIKGFGILCLANSMTATRLLKLESRGLFLDSQTILYIGSWGFGYRTDFLVFTRNKNAKFETIKDGAQNIAEGRGTAYNSAMLQGLKPHAGNTGTSA